MVKILNYGMGNEAENQNSILIIPFMIYLCATLTSMAVMSVGLVLFLAVWLIHLFLGRSQFVWTSPIQNYFKITVGLILVCTSSLVFAWYSWDSTSMASDLKGLSKFWHFLTPIPIAMAWMGFSKNKRGLILKVYLGFAALIATLGVVEYFTGFLFQRPILSDPGRFHTQVFFKFHLTYASVMIFPFFLWMGFKSVSRPVRIMVLVISFLALIFTYSRTLWLSLPFGIFIALVAYFLRRVGFQFLWKKILLGLAVLAFLGALVFQLPVVKNRFEENSGLIPRAELWKGHLKMLEHNPIFGVGFRKNSKYLAALYDAGKLPFTPNRTIISHAHSNYLEFLGSTGVLGLIVFMAWIIFVTKQSLQFYRPWLFCAWIVFWLNGLTQVNLLEGKVIHQAMLMVGLSLGSVLNRSENPESLS